VSKVIWQEAASPSCLFTRHGGECIRPLRALGRHTPAGALKMREWKMQEWKIQELKHMESQ